MTNKTSSQLKYSSNPLFAVFINSKFDLIFYINLIIYIKFEYFFFNLIDFDNTVYF